MAKWENKEEKDVAKVRGTWGLGSTRVNLKTTGQAKTLAKTVAGACKTTFNVSNATMTMQMTSGDAEISDHGW